ncbi:type VII secretion target [Haloglycomyces albus]|uniref:type VII secretion target n=1 Tax=Haloglycomyces albus TaxID=526067 RepID=UPI00046CA8D8|nr:type VII secretion target [Haloglycomyces albus]
MSNDVAAEPDDLESGAEKIRKSGDEIDNLLDYMQESNPDWWAWGMPGLVFAGIYFNGVELIRNQVEEDKQALEGVAKKVEKAAKNYRDTDKAQSKNIRDKGNAEGMA